MSSGNTYASSNTTPPSDTKTTAPLAAKDDFEKPDLALLPRVFKETVARVMMFGAKKYGRWNYTKGHDIEQLIAAAERHLDALKDGEDVADDSKLSHWGHIAANALMALHQIQLKTIRDGRFKRKEEN
jgi:hypothetical protein